MPTVALNLLLAENRVYSGDTLDAKVLLDSADPDTVINEFSAEVRGVGRTGWVNIHTDKIYETEKEYMQVTVPLCPQGVQLKPGRHQFQLHVPIAENAPSSYESQFGTIRYFVKVTLLTNSEQSSAIEVFPFAVLSRVYFDDIPNATMQRIDYKDEIDFTVCSLPFGTVYLTISLPRTGFCLGETIPAKVMVKNSTRKALKECRMQLILKAQFEAMSRYEHISDRKVIEHVLQNIPLGRIKGRSDVNIDVTNLSVPPNAVPTHQHSKSEEVNMIVLSYVLRFSADPGIEVEIPVILTALGYRDPSRAGAGSPSSLGVSSNGRRVSIFEVNETGKAAVFYC
ncbi:Protein ARRD-15 b [Aphelenchoides avenae]|nr:Protein ARRD-15 b [Aphelenchus avenae]